VSPGLEGLTAREGSVRRSRPYGRQEGEDTPRCPACQRAVSDGEEMVAYGGDEYHADCALYRRPPLRT
jgi:hypothetical protein